jgi:hypothetical protein
MSRLDRRMKEQAERVAAQRQNLAAIQQRLGGEAEPKRSEEPSFRILRDLEERE